MRPTFILTLLAVSLLSGCAGSSSHLLGTARAPIDPAQVQIYRTPPAHFERIATLDASSGARFFHGSQATDADAIQRLKEAAAKVGANGVLLTLVGDEPSGSIGLGFGGGGYSRNTAVNGEASGAAPLVRTGAHGLAIYVPAQR
ncbi:MAG: hypothetical protein H0X40_03165 [Chthoniobacterales bacterium]|nr:hypothetical protein [Chthoniobacterales bacterium]